MPQLSLGTRLSAGGPLTSLPRRVAAILRKFGSNAHVWMPGPGVPVLGPELISNGDFSNGTTGWNISGGSAQYGVSAAGGELSFAGSAAYINVSKLDILTIGKTYQCTFTVKSRSAGSVRFNGGGSVGTFRTAPGTYTEVFTATAHDDFSIQDTNGTLVATIDDVSVKELLGYSTLLNGFQAANYLEANASGAPQVVDQPVGYVGDAANVTLGANIVGNSTFDDSSWWGFSGATVSGGKLSLVTAGTYVGVSKSNTLIIGKTYQVEADVVINSGTSGVWVGSTLDGVQRATTGKLTGVFTATAATLEVKRASGSFPLDATVDNVIVREITGAIPATQATTANKPFLRRGHVNRCPYSMDMSNASWGTSFAGRISANNTDPIGGNTALLLRVDNTTNSHYLYGPSIQFLAGVTYTQSVSIKAGTVSRIQLTFPGAAFGTANYANFNLTGSGSVLAVGGGTASITQEANGFYRCSLSVVCTTAGSGSCPVVAFINADNATRFPSFAGNSTDSVYVAFAQLETGSVANAFVPTTTAAASSNTGGYWWEFGNEATPNDQIKLPVAPFTWQDDHAVVTAFFHQRSTGSCVVFGGVSDAASARLCQIYTNNGLTQISWVPDTGGALVASGSVMGIGEARVMSGVRRGADGILRENAVVKQTIPVGGLTAATIDTWALGAHKNTVANPLSGGIFATIAIKGTVTDADLKILEKWVGQQAGVQIA